jgi:hypothetical protein
MPTLLQIRTAVRSKIDRVNAATPTNTELNAWINESAAELWDLLVTVYEDQYSTYATTQDAQASVFSIANLSTLFGLLVPSGHEPVRLFKLREVEYQQNGQWYPLPPVMKQEWWKYASVTDLGYPRGYTLIGADIHVMPAATPSQQYRIFYIPAYADMVDDANSLFLVPNHWDEYVVVDACIKARIKLQQDPSAEMQRKAELRQRIKGAATNRTPGGSRKIVERATHREEN